ncbi:PIN domain nuclease [Mycolicibacterium fortuitum]
MLDTNALLWRVSAPDRVAASAREVLEHQANELFISVVIGMGGGDKTRIGRLNGAPLLSARDEALAGMNATEPVIDSADATMASQLDWERKDPLTA